MDTRDMLISLDIAVDHNWDKMYEKIVKHDTTIFEEIEKEESGLNIIIQSEVCKLLSEGYKVVTIVDREEYPQILLHTAIRPPFVVYYKGSIDTLEDRVLKITKRDLSRSCLYVE